MRCKTPVLLLGPLVFSFMLMLNPIKAATAEISDPFGQDRAKSKPFKIVVNLEYTEKQYKEGVGKIEVEYEDGGDFKKTKTYDFDEMMERAWPDHVKVKVNFPRNTVSNFKDGHDNCLNDSRSLGVNKERVHLKIP